VVRHIRSNAVAYLALFVALSGSAYAASKVGSNDIARNAVLSKHIKNRQVKAADLEKPKLIKVKPNPQISGDDPCDDSDGPTPLRMGTFCGPANPGSTGGPAYIGDEGNGYAPSVFYKAGGQVHLSGKPFAYGYSPPTVILILPPGYRPAKKVGFSQGCYDGYNNVYGSCFISVSPDGTVMWEFGTRYTYNGTPGEIYLDGIAFVPK
jgi:hypothetical protein